MKILVAYYSRTGTTKKVAAALADKLGAELEEIKDTVARSGAIGYLKSGRDGMQRNLTKLEPIAKNPADYDLVIVGTPIWSWSVSAPVRTYLTEQKNNFRQVAFFCTMGGNYGKTFVEMEELVGQEPIGTLALTTRDVVKDEFRGKLDKFPPNLN